MPARLVPDDVALFRMVDVARYVDLFRSAGVAPPADLLDVLCEFETRRVQSGFDPVSPLAVGDSGAENCTWVTAKAAARRLKMTEQSVTKAARKGRLTGRRCGDGRSWEIKESSLAEYELTKEIQRISREQEEHDDLDRGSA